MGGTPRGPRRDALAPVGPQDEAIGRAVTASVLMFTSVLLGFAFAFVLALFQGGYYLPIVMPFVMGTGIASLSLVLSQKIAPGADSRSALVVLLGVVIAYCGYQALVYGSALEHLRTILETDPQGALTTLTGSEGYWAFLQFVTEPIPMGAEGAQPGALVPWQLSPLGMVGQFVHSTGLMLGIMTLELIAAVGGAIWAIRRQYAPPESEATPSSARTETLAQVDDETLLQAMQALERGEVARAGQLLGGTDAPVFTVLMHYPADLKRDHVLEIRDATAGTVKARKLLDQKAAWALTDAARLAEAERRYGV